MQNENSLCHYGVLGMKWGRRKKRYAQSEEQHKTQLSPEEHKKQIFESRDPKKIYENRHLFNKDELMTAYTIMNTEKNIKSLIPKEVSRGEQFIDNTIKWGKKTSDLLSTGANVINNGNNFLKAIGVKTGKDTSKINTAAQAAKKVTDDAVAKAKKEKEANAKKEAKAKAKEEKNAKKTDKAYQKAMAGKEAKTRESQRYQDVASAWTAQYFTGQTNPNSALLLRGPSSSKSNKRRRRNK